MRISRGVLFTGKSVVLPYAKGVSYDLLEPSMVVLLKILLAISQGIFLDLAVNTGRTLVMVKSIGLHREHVGIESNPFCVSCVQILI